MGQKLSREEIAELQLETRFTPREIEHIFKVFQRISSLKHWDGVIDKDEFFAALEADGFDNPILDHLFHEFDMNHNGQLDFREFVVGLSIFLKGSLEERIRHSFNVYDLDGNGVITRAELEQAFAAMDVMLCSLSKIRRRESVMSMDTVQGRARRLADEAFRDLDVNHDDRLSFEEYHRVMETHAEMGVCTGNRNVSTHQGCSSSELVW